MTTETKFDCVFCKEVFEDKADLLVHFRKHGDPKFNTKCKSRQQNEVPKNEKTTEENELVGCDVCEEVFPTISKAITHKHKSHPDHDAKYFCPFCGKLFTMKHLYNKHLQTNHEFCEGTDSNDFHCDCCEVTFYVPSAMLYHNKFFHRQDTELPAFGQSKKVKTYNQEPLQIYYCAFCGEEYNNKVNLHKHIGDDHGDENQSPTEILRCPLCEAIFYHLDAYELHLTFHSTDDMYSEQNEMKEKVTEFSLEAVSPIIEKVEEEEEDGMNTASIDNFLQLVMGESADNDAPDKVKSKKHKKHKKSKKAAITLDEFLNMNKDVFGDGLNVQGIEEVPTQVVLKKVKGKRIPNKPEPKVVNADLAKLKKHGIVVKTKSGNNPLSTNFNKEGNKSNVISTPNEILSKLMNQGNKEIKIVKKSLSQNVKLPDIANLTTNTVDKPIDTIINTVVTTDNKEETDNLTKTDTPHTENDIDVNGEISNNSQDNENPIKNYPNLETAIDKAVEDNRDEIENDKKTISESNSSHIADTTIPPAILEEKNTISSNFNLPNSNQLPKSSHDTKVDFILDNTAAKETFSSATSIQHSDDYNEKEVENNVANTTLNALKHLSHLITVKPVLQSKTTNASCRTNEMIDHENKDLEIKNNDKESVSPKPLPIDQKLVISKPLGEHITMRPAMESPSSPTFNSDAESESGELNENGESKSNIEFNKLDEHDSLNKNVVEVRKLKIRNPPINQAKIAKNNETDDDEGDFKNEECHKKMTNLDILKRLTNVTAKPISVTTGISQISNTKQDNTNITQVRDEVPKKPCKSSIDDEIEIFNIDDSDSEDNESDVVNNKTENTPSNLPLTALRHLGKNIVVKSNQKNVFQNELKIDNKNRMLNKQSPEIQKSINLQNKLKILGGNIVVKPRNSSPNTFNKGLLKSFGDYEDDDDDDEANDSGSESNISKVKISEIHDNDSDNEGESQNNTIVESPNVSNSEHEDNNDDDMEDDLSDFENQIKSNTLKKEDIVSNSNKTTSLENFKNLNKDLTIKSFNTKKQDSEGDINLLSQKEITEDKPNVNKQVVTKQLKTNLLQNEQPINKSSQQASTSTNQTSFNKKVSTSSNQVNTVKTVKRFQSQTVIEEITTTVTKTIRTVNQSTNEVVQNRCNPRPMIRSQKIINKLPGRELQGTAVRHSSPPVGTKIRNATNIVRHSNSAIVRPSNQLVPVRPVLNLPRPSAPSAPGVRKVVPPKCSPQKPVIGKLKISPQALNQATKRPSEEATGHFSCFKKPKDSFLNTTDMADCDDDNAMQFTSASQSRSDFSTVTKTVKGKGLTATQTRSEISTNSQQQLSRLSNVSGLKIVKTCSKQATQVEEKYEINNAKKNTLDALEKLQRQGLLIKKPRIDDYNEHPNSYSESEDEENEK